jgi:hypothetical protein
VPTQLAEYPSGRSWTGNGPEIAMIEAHVPVKGDRERETRFGDGARRRPQLGLRALTNEAIGFADVQPESREACPPH